MIAEKLLPGIETSPVPMSFEFSDAEVISETFIKFQGIVQVGVFGSVARYGIGDSVKLALVVGDDLVFRKYVTIVDEYQLRTGYARDERLIRLSAFDVVFGRFIPGWHNCHPKYDFSLLSYLDVTVLPFNWQQRLAEIDPMLERATPCPLTVVCETVTWLQTEV